MSTTALEPQSIPLPPDDLMIAVCGHAIHAEFARSRLSGPRQMLKDFESAGIKADQLKDVLDLGCGCGRFLAGWSMIGASFKLHGCDFNPLLVKWCQEFIPDTETRLNALGEPIPYKNESMDLVYLLSVFTHLTLAEQGRLVAEFHRVLRPDGYVFISFHGEHFYPTMLPLVPNGDATFKRDGFLIKNADQEGSNDCWTLHSVENMIHVFTGFIPVLHFRSIDRGPTDVAAWQDILVFKKVFKKASKSQAFWYRLRRKLGWGTSDDIRKREF